MKRCSKCGRTYDESLTFCLEDGTVLSPPFNPQQTLRNDVRATSEPPPTEVLRPERSVEVTTKKSSQNWLLYGSIAFAVVVLFIVGIAWISWAVTNSGSRSTTNSPQTTSNPSFSPPASPTPAAIDLSGAWRDAYGNTSQVTQTGDTFNLTGRGTACRGSYVITGTGTVNGNRIEMSYESNYSRGQCQGTISAGGRRLTSTCFDSACGQFLSVSERQ